MYQKLRRHKYQIKISSGSIEDLFSTPTSTKTVGKEKNKNLGSIIISEDSGIIELNYGNIEDLFVQLLSSYHFQQEFFEHFLVFYPKFLTFKSVIEILIYNFTNTESKLSTKLNNNPNKTLLHNKSIFRKYKNKQNKKFETETLKETEKEKEKELELELEKEKEKEKEKDTETKTEKQESNEKKELTLNPRQFRISYLLKLWLKLRPSDFIWNRDVVGQILLPFVSQEIRKLAPGISLELRSELVQCQNTNQRNSINSLPFHKPAHTLFLSENKQEYKQKQKNKKKRTLSLLTQKNQKENLFETEMIAQQLCLIDSELFQKINPTEFFFWPTLRDIKRIETDQEEEKNNYWELPKDIFEKLNLKENKKYLNIKNKEMIKMCPNIIAALTQFEKVRSWVIQSIVESPIEKRSESLENFLKLASTLSQYKNYQSFFSVVSALQSPIILQMGGSWKNVSIELKRGMDQLTTITSRKNCYRVYRKIMGSSKKPLIPFLDFFLYQLAQLYDKENDYLIKSNEVQNEQNEKNEKNEKKEKNEKNEQNKQRKEKKVINFKKWRIISKKIVEINKTFQRDNLYNFQKDEMLYQFLLNLKIESEEILEKKLISKPQLNYAHLILGASQTVVQSNKDARALSFEHGCWTKELRVPIIISNFKLVDQIEEEEIILKKLKKITENSNNNMQSVSYELNPTDNSMIIIGASIDWLVEYLCSDFSDPKFVQVFLLTYRSFITSKELIRALKRQFTRQPPTELSGRMLGVFIKKIQKPGKLKVFNVLNQLIRGHSYAFTDDQQLINEIKELVAFATKFDPEMKGPGILIERLLLKLRKEFSGNKLLQINNRREENVINNSHSIFINNNNAKRNNGNIDKNDDVFVDKENNDYKNETDSLINTNDINDINTNNNTNNININNSNNNVVAVVYNNNYENKMLKSVKLIDEINFQSIKIKDFIQQLTLIEFAIYSKILPTECFNQAWTKKDKEIRAPYLTTMAHWFNQLSEWTNYEILKEKNLRKRVNIITKFIDIGKYSKKIHNFNSCQEITAALGTSSIHRLKKTWSNVAEKFKRRLGGLMELTKRKGNFVVMRKALEFVKRPALPYPGIWLTDLVFIDDGHQDFVFAPDGRTKLINFEKRKQTAKIILDIQKFQKIPYTFQPMPEIQNWLKRELTAEYPKNKLYNMSLILEPRNKK
ncbi:guanine nucleotide exchange factor [Anaeramoeba flamelloides]|uniref:Guanine nucleotide exchange factor n=1 Tax=Anaeramoeba flamelloides TaxID=1746091 RepID=A0AAV7Z8B1_9EUKA|nr:guanine nucleotide exchange factor [Anaeramoeba flamelloides]